MKQSATKSVYKKEEGQKGQNFRRKRQNAVMGWRKPVQGDAGLL